MGEIHVARTRPVRGKPRLVALKILLPEAAEQGPLVGMFMDEAAIMAQIHHPNVLEVLEFGREESLFYLAMEYLQGRPLARVMIDTFKGQGSLHPTVVAVIGAGAARGLHAAHTAVGRSGEPLNVIHRDVSPQNLFVTYEGTTKVLDFGIARANERITKTSTGMFKGKAAYMSPEHVKGMEIDARSDVFALGVCLWEMVAGRRLFLREQQFATLMAVEEAPIEPPTRLGGQNDERLDAIILRALERDHSRRTPDAGTLSSELMGYVRDRKDRFPQTMVAELMEQLFGDEAKEEQALLRKFERSATASLVDISRLRDLSGISHAPMRRAPDAPEGRVITFAGRLADAEALDRLSAPKLQPVVLQPEREPTPADRSDAVHSAIEALQAQLWVEEKRRATQPPAPPPFRPTEPPPAAPATSKPSALKVVLIVAFLAIVALAGVIYRQQANVVVVLPAEEAADAPVASPPAPPPPRAVAVPAPRAVVAAPSAVVATATVGTSTRP